VENGQVRLPRTDRVTILLCHHASDLCEMSEIVRHPSCQELLQRHNAERGMLSGELELCGRQTPSAQFAKIQPTGVGRLRTDDEIRALLLDRVDDTDDLCDESHEPADEPRHRRRTVNPLWLTNPNPNRFD
jgi:hypothetical protein